MVYATASSSSEAVVEVFAATSPRKPPGSVLVTDIEIQRFFAHSISLSEGFNLAKMFTNELNFLSKLAYTSTN